MKKFYIHKIDETGAGRCVLEIQAQTIENAWNGCKSWFIAGTFYVISADGYTGKIFEK